MGATEDLKQKAGLVKLKDINDLLLSLRPELERAIPKHLDADRLLRIAMTQVSANDDLRQCDAHTLLASVMIASQLGLQFGGGQAYLIPYKKTCTFVPGWKGLLDIMLRSGRAVAWTGAVNVGDEFDWQLGDSPSVTHRPRGNEGELKYCYAIGRQKGMDWPIVEVWSADKILDHLKRYNKVGEKHYALANPNNWEMYGRKVVLLQALKYLPQSAELMNAVVLDQQAAIGKQQLQLKPADLSMILPSAEEKSEPPQETKRETIVVETKTEVETKPEPKTEAIEPEPEPNQEPETKAPTTQSVEGVVLPGFGSPASETKQPVKRTTVSALKEFECHCSAFHELPLADGKGIYMSLDVMSKGKKFTLICIKPEFKEFLQNTAGHECRFECSTQMKDGRAYYQIENILKIYEFVFKDNKPVTTGE